MSNDIHVKSWERKIDRRASLHLPPPRLDYRPVNQRVRDFEEACLGFTPETARLEASRCIQCPEMQACVLACPLHNDIPSAMWEISHGNFTEAACIYRQTSNFPELCGRLCPDEFLCAGSCGVGKLHPSVRLGRLEVFVAEEQRRKGNYTPPAVAKVSGKRAAVVGSGPAGLTVAEQLALRGHHVTIFEKNSKPGGTLAYSIPRFRLPLEIIESKIEELERIGIEIVTNVQIGVDLSIGELFARGYQAIMLGTGAGREAPLELPGTKLKGVQYASGFLMRTNLIPAYLPAEMNTPLKMGKRVVVYGCGHAAIDSARTAIRLGAGEVICVYPGTAMEMLCRMEDKLAAAEEGVIFQHLTKPVCLVGDDTGKVCQAICQQMRLRCEGRVKSYEPVEGATFNLPVDSVILALELGPDTEFARHVKGLELDAQGWIVCDPHSGQTSRQGIFAAGDNNGDQHLAAFAIAEARQVADSIHKYLT
jgi:glutamate synthase (NADPH) small chain